MAIPFKRLTSIVIHDNPKPAISEDGAFWQRCSPMPWSAERVRIGNEMVGDSDERRKVPAQPNARAAFGVGAIHVRLPSIAKRLIARWRRRSKQEAT